MSGRTTVNSLRSFACDRRTTCTAARRRPRSSPAAAQSTQPQPMDQKTGTRAHNLTHAHVHTHVHTLRHTHTCAHMHLPRGIGLDCAAVVVASGLGIIQHVHQERCVRRQKLCVIWRVSKGTRVPGGNVWWHSGSAEQRRERANRASWAAREGKEARGSAGWKEGAEGLGALGGAFWRERSSAVYDAAARTRCKASP